MVVIIEANLGEARVLADWTKNQMTKRRDSEQSKVNDEMSHIRAPKIGYEAINKKNGKTRVWTGEHWLEN